MAGSTIKLASGYEMPLVGFGLWKVPAASAADIANADAVVDGEGRGRDGAADRSDDADSLVAE